METLSESVWRSLRAVDADVSLIAHGGKNRALVVWIPFAVIRLALQLLRRRTRMVLVGDALMYACVAPLLWLTRTPHATMVMGLDVTYRNPIYRFFILRALRQAPNVIAISSSTARAAITTGVAADRVSVVRLGVQAPDLNVRRTAARADLERQLGISQNATLLLTVGRLVRRKGVDWFVSSVLPYLPPSVMYVISGRGPEADRIERSARAAGVADRVYLTGEVDEETRERLFAGADLFVQPNIPVVGDMEGFGLVVVEAAVRGLPPVVSAIEGLVDAVVDGETGILVPAEDDAAWADRLHDLLGDRDSLHRLGEKFRDRARELYGEESMGTALLALLRGDPKAPSSVSAP